MASPTAQATARSARSPRALAALAVGSVLWALQPAAATPGQASPTEKATSPRSVDVETFTDERPDPTNEWAVNGEIVHEAMSSGDVRVLVLGDSFGIQSWSRVFLPIMGRWPYGPVTALAGGATQSNELVQGAITASPFRRIEAPGDDYRVMPDEFPPVFFALPIRGIQEYRLDSAFDAPAGRLQRLRIWNDTFRMRIGEPFVGIRQRLGARILTFTPPFQTWTAEGFNVYHNADILGSVTLNVQARPKFMLGQDPEGFPVAPTPRQINAVYPDYTFTTSSTEVEAFPDIELRVDNLVLDRRHLHIAGAVFYKVDNNGDRVPGIYYSSLADASWSYFGFGDDRVSFGATDKSFDSEQLAHWLDVTTLDRQQPMVVYYYLAAEGQPNDLAIEKFENMRTQTANAAASAGIETVIHCFVLPHYHAIQGQAGSNVRADFSAKRFAMYDLARRYDDTAAFSLYDATHGVFFEGTRNAIMWIEHFGYDSFSYGDNLNVNVAANPVRWRLLDGGRLHPRNPDTSAVFADVLARLISTAGACNPADLADPRGTLDIDDVLLFLDAFSSQRPRGDLASPEGVFDIDDVLTFLSAFAAGCDSTE